MVTVVPNGWCPTCRRSVSSWRPGPGQRPDAACPHCHSLERHRIAALVLDWLAPLLLQDDGLVVEAAPTPTVRRMLLDRVGRERYLGFDLGLDARIVDFYADLTRLPLADASLAVLVCFHVLEHVPDDAAAMREIGRVIADDGLALVSNPWRRHGPTDEDPDAPEDERIRRFGQADHVRIYGEDFEDRLREAGMDVLRFEPLLRMPVDLALLTNVGDGPMWLCTRAGERGAALRERLRVLLPPVGGLPNAVRAAQVAPVLVVPGEPDGGDDGGSAAAARALRDVPGLRVAHDIGALEQVERLVSVLRDGQGDRRRFADEQLLALDGAVRRHVGAAPDERWGESLHGLASDTGRALVELVLERLPDAQVLHVVDPAVPLSEPHRRLRRLCLEQGPGRYLEVDRTGPDRAAVARFLGTPRSDDAVA